LFGQVTYKFLLNKLQQLEEILTTFWRIILLIFHIENMIKMADFYNATQVVQRLN